MLTSLDVMHLIMEMILACSTFSNGFCWFVTSSKTIERGILMGFVGLLLHLNQ